jgi:allantoinase
MKVKTRNMTAIPYCMEINDIPLYIRKGYTGEQYFRSYTGEQYFRSVMDQFEQLLADSAKQPRVMGIPLHPMISGQPLRIKYLERLLTEMKKFDNVWFATAGEIVDAYLQVHPNN